MDSTPFEIAVRNHEAQIARLRVQLLSAEASSRNLEEQLKGATGQKEAIDSKLKLSRLRLEQYKELAESGAGNRFDFEQAQASVQDLEGQRAAMVASESQARGTLGAKTPEGEQDEVRKIKPGQEAEVAFKMYPGRIVKCKVDSIMWATAQGQLPIGSMNPAGGVAPIPQHSLAVRLLPDGKDKDLFLAAGAHGAGAVFTDSGHAIHVLRKVMVRVGAKIDWLILKLH